MAEKKSRDRNRGFFLQGIIQDSIFIMLRTIRVLLETGCGGRI